MNELIKQISSYEQTEEQFRRSCCTAQDLCDHQVVMTIPLDLWLELKEILLKMNDPVQSTKN